MMTFTFGMMTFTFGMMTFTFGMMTFAFAFAYQVFLDKAANLIGNAI